MGFSLNLNKPAVNKNKCVWFVKANIICLKCVYLKFCRAFSYIVKIKKSSDIYLVKINKVESKKNDQDR